MKKNLRFLPLIGAALLLGPASGSAQVWQNTNTSFPLHWGTTGNWLGGLPSISEIAEFNRAVPTPLPITVLMDRSPTIEGISFGPAASSYIIRQDDTPQTLTLHTITNNSAYDQLIDGSQLTLARNEKTFAVNGSGDLTIAVGGAISLTGAFTLGLGGTGTGLGTVSSAITGGGFVSTFGTATWELTGTNTYSGKTALHGGVLSVATIGDGGVASNLGASSANASNLFFNGGTLRYTGVSASTNRNFTAVGPVNIEVDRLPTNLTLSGVAVGLGASLNKTGAGTLTLTGDNTDIYNTRVSSGWLQLGNGGTTGSVNGIISVDDRATVIFNRSDSVAFGGVISGAGAVTKAGSGTLSLAGANTYSGATGVAAGTLLVNGSLGNTAVTVTSGATLGGTGTIGGLVTMLAGSRLAAGNSPGMLTFTSGLGFRTGAIIDFELGTSSDLFRISGGFLSGPAGLGGITLNLVDSGGFNPFVGGSFTLFDYAGATLNNFDLGDFTFGTLLAGTSLSNYSFAFAGSKLLLAITGTGTPVSSVPDAGSSLALFAAALLGLAAGRRRLGCRAGSLIPPSRA